MLGSFTSYDHCCLFCSGFGKTKAISLLLWNVINRKRRIQIIRGATELLIWVSQQLLSPNIQKSKLVGLANQTHSRSDCEIFVGFYGQLLFFKGMFEQLKHFQNSNSKFLLNRRSNLSGLGPIHHYFSNSLAGSQLLSSSWHFDEPSNECVGFQVYPLRVCSALMHSRPLLNIA